MHAPEPILLCGLPPAGGGPIHVTNIDCRGGVAALRSSGGRVAVDSLDGNLSIHSDGGNVQVGRAKERSA